MKEFKDHLQEHPACVDNFLEYIVNEIGEAVDGQNLSIIYLCYSFYTLKFIVELSIIFSAIFFKASFCTLCIIY